MCPAWESNQQPFSSQAGTQSTEPHHPGLHFNFYLLNFFKEKGSGRYREGRGERETSICCSTYLCIHWLLLVRALTGDLTRNLGVSGQCSNQLSYPFTTVCLCSLAEVSLSFRQLVNKFKCCHILFLHSTVWLMAGHDYTPFLHSHVLSNQLTILKCTDFLHLLHFTLATS